LRIVLAEQKRTRTINRLVKFIEWLPIHKGAQIWKESRCLILDEVEKIEETNR